MGAAEYQERTVRPEEPIDLRLTLGPLVLELRGPCARFGDGGVWRATRTPAGPATLFVTAEPAAGAIRGRAWGPGADWVLDRLPATVGAEDQLGDFPTVVDRHPVVADLFRRRPGLRLPRTRSVLEVLVPTIVGQKVIGQDAGRSYRRLLAARSDPAPGAPGAARGLRLPIAPEVLAATPSWAFHRFEIDATRAATLRRAGTHAAALEAAADLPLAEARDRLALVPGIGPWTTAKVALVAFGDPDAVLIGDYHVHDQVTFALTGRARGDDGEMLRLLEPFRGHRGRVVRLIEVGGGPTPRFGPRLARAADHGTAWAAEARPG